MALLGLLAALLAAPGVFAQGGLLQFNSSTTCTANTTCPGAATAGFAFEAANHAVPNSPFYTVPSNFSRELAPGTLLKVEVSTDLRNYTVPSGLTMSRIMYTTTDLNGTILPASAYILWPAHLPADSPGCGDSSGLSMVAWAHGTSGVFATCGPSSYKAIQYHFMVPYAIALQGMVVVAPDYAGLGVSVLPDGKPVPHIFSAAPAQANDVANAIIAARAAFPAYLTAKSPFVTMGHSQGGGVAWAFAERQAVQPVPGYKGTVTLAPPTAIIKQIARANKDLVNNITHTWTFPTLAIVQQSTIAGITAVYPSFNYTGMTAKGYDRFHNVLAKIQACLAAQTLIFSDLQPAEWGVPGWTETPFAREFEKRVTLGGKKVAGPFLVIAGGSDTTIPVEGVAATLDDTCTANKGANGMDTNIEMVVYEGQDHFPIIQASQDYWLPWIKDRLQGKALSSKGKAAAACTKRNVPAFRKDFNQALTTPNWLVTGVTDPKEVWKYTF
jgi:pimeloyl-ACP methyl ester carboxylesterase